MPLPMVCLLLFGEGLNKWSGLRVPVDQMFAAQLTGYYHFATRVNARRLTDVNQTRGI
jgi:hypothetical protein